MYFKFRAIWCSCEHPTKEVAITTVAPPSVGYSLSLTRPEHDRGDGVRDTAQKWKKNRNYTSYWPSQLTVR